MIVCLWKAYSLRLYNVFHPINRFPNKTLDSSKLKEFADNNFKFVENGRKLFKQVEHNEGKGEIARYEQFLLFPQCFQKTYKYSRHVKTRACLEKS